MGKNVLIVEDDAALAALIALSLRKQGLEATTASRGGDALRLAYRQHPDLVILDVVVPQMDGLEVCSRLKQMSDVPVLMLSARSTESDVIRGFEVGADDYMRKPFSLGELNARVKALLRYGSSGDGKTKPGHLEHKDLGLALDLARRQASLRGNPLHLSPTEFRLLAYLMENAGRVVSHRELLNQVWGPEYAREAGCLRLYVRYLRRKLGDDSAHPRYIANVRGVGYVFAEQ
ncbi:MAG: response regulator transcription factor [Anaerolineae bacterium]